MNCFVFLFTRFDLFQSDYHMQVWIKALSSFNESPLFPVSADRWPALQLWGTNQESLLRSMQIAETLLGGWQQSWWRHSLWRRGDISLRLCVSQQMTTKFMEEKEEKLEQGVFQCTQKGWGGFAGAHLNSWISSWPASICKVKETFRLLLLECQVHKKKLRRFKHSFCGKALQTGQDGGVHPVCWFENRGGILIFFCLLALTDSPPFITIAQWWKAVLIYVVLVVVCCFTVALSV